LLSVRSRKIDLAQEINDTAINLATAGIRLVHRSLPYLSVGIDLEFDNHLELTGKAVSCLKNAVSGSHSVGTHR